MSAEPAAISSSERNRLQPLVEVEQVRLAVEQVRRIPLPHLLIDVCVAGTGAHAGLGMFALGWLVVMTIAQLARTWHVTRAHASGRLAAPAVLRLMAWWLVTLAAIQAVMMVAVFRQPMGDSHYILTMIFVGTAAGAVTPAAGHVRSYFMWESVFGGALFACWLAQGTLESSVIALLLVALFVTLTLYVRDQGRLIHRLVELTESLRQERDRAELASEAKTRFFAAASHDLRQPLTALSYNAATVQALAATSGDEILTRVGAAIRSALDDSHKLLNSLLEISELDAGVIRAQAEDVELDRLVGGVLAAFAPQARDRGLILGSRLAEGPTYVRADPVLLRRILDNLVGNAIKFTERGSVSIETEPLPPSAGAVRICIVDTGPGIPAGVEERVFEEFFQVGNPDRNRSQGLGLGLAIVRRLSGLLGTQVLLRNWPGQGCTFAFDLPTGRAVAPPAAAAPRVAAGMRPRSVLVVDDEVAIRDSLSTFLATLRWRIRAVPDLEGAVACLREGFSPDAILLDFRLRGGQSGLEVLEELRRGGCDALVWLITGDTEPTRVAAAHAAGVPVVYKPVDGVELAFSIEAALLEREAQAAFGGIGPVG